MVQQVPRVRGRTVEVQNHKVISVMQPWASLLVKRFRGNDGHLRQPWKRYETRSWETMYRGPLLIHSSAGLPKWVYDLCHAYNEFFDPWFDMAGPLDRLPRGCIVGKVDLVDCHYINRKFECDLFGFDHSRNIREWHFGDFEHGRFAWFCNNAVAFDNPIPAKGRLGLWNWQGELPGLVE